jgi:putative membrane protein
MLAEYYLWIQALHIIAIISWMAAMLYLPRLFVYHADTKIGTPQSETFKIMEKRLIRYIGTPAMLATWIFGILMVVANPDVFQGGWMHVKFTLVFLLSAFHGMSAGWMKKFQRDENTKPARFYRVANEVPTILMITIVILAIVKPF